MSTFGGLSSFGGAPQQQQQSFGFGTPTQSTFGQPQPQQSQQQQPSSVFNFSTPQQNTSTFRFQNFGTPATTASNSFGSPAPTSTFSFNTPAQTQGSSFGGQQSAFGTSQPFSFSTPQVNTVSSAPFSSSIFSTPQVSSTTTSTSFPSFGTSTTQSTGFGPTPSFSFNTPTQPQTSAPSIFSNQPGFQSNTAGFKFPSFGTTTTGTGGFGATNTFSFTPTPAAQPGSLFAPPQQQAQQMDPSTAFYLSIFECSKFGDERDKILQKFNFCQASLGKGKGYFSNNYPPVIYTPDNPLYRFRAVGYSFIYNNNNEDGLVSMEIKSPPEKMKGEESQFLQMLKNAVNKAGVAFKMDGIKGAGGDVTTLNIYAEDEGSLRRVPAIDLATALQQPHIKTQLEKHGISNIIAKVKPSPEQLKRYLKTPPPGTDERVWKQAQEDNPDPANMIPTPIVGLEAIKTWLHKQENESDHHEARLTIIQEDCATYLNNYSTIAAELAQMKRKQSQLTHRLLSVLVSLEINRRGMSPLDEEEVVLNETFSSIDSELSSPTEYRGRLKELLSQLKCSSGGISAPKYSFDESSLGEIYEFLTTQQLSIKLMVESVRNDREIVEEIQRTLSEPQLQLKF